MYPAQLTDLEAKAENERRRLEEIEEEKAHLREEEEKAVKMTGSCWNNTVRSDANAAENTISVPREKQDKLSIKERGAFVNEATHRLPKKFSFMSRQVGSENAFKNSYNLSILIERLGEQACEHDVLQGFNIFDTKNMYQVDGSLGFTNLPRELISQPPISRT